VQTVFSLQAEPQSGPLPRELAKPESHAPRDRLLFGEHLVEDLPRHSEERDYFGSRLAKRQHIFVQDRAGMHWSDAYQKRIYRHHETRPIKRTPFWRSQQDSNLQPAE
jgi:hypothetical protein